MYIAEIGWNFMGDMTLAEEMISAASESGATHVKFQYWREENLKPGEWDNDGRRQIYISAQLDEEKILQIEFQEIFQKKKIKEEFRILLNFFTQRKYCIQKMESFSYHLLQQIKILIIFLNI